MGIAISPTSRQFQSDRKKSRIACFSLGESSLRRLITVFASEGP